jgi:multidrug resistance efflux pump
MAKFKSETLAGVGFLDAGLRTAPSTSGVIQAAPRTNGGVQSSPTSPVESLDCDECLPEEPLASAVDTRRGGQDQTDDTVPAASTDSKLLMDTQPGLGAKTRVAVHGSGPVRRSGTQVRVSTQNGTSVRPGALQEAAQPAVETRETPVPSVELPHDTLRGVGKSDAPVTSQTLPFLTMPKHMEVSAGAPLDIDVYTSAPGITLPIGTRLPKPLLDAGQTPRFRGFATNPPITPKILTRSKDDANIGVAPTGDEAHRARAPQLDQMPRFDQTVAFGVTPSASAAQDSSITESPVTPRARRPLAASSATDVPKAPWSTVVSERIETQPVAIHRATEETFRPSAHTTPPGLPEVQRRPRSYVWVLAALPMALVVALVTLKLEATSTAQGVVVLDGGTTPVVNRVSGPIVQILVKPGDMVAAGQAVAELDVSTLHERRDELQTQEAALLAEQERVTTLGAKWHSAATEALQRKRGLLWQRLKLHSDSTPDVGAKGRSNVERDAVLLIRQELADVEFELNRRESDRDEQQRTWEHRISEVRAALSHVNATSTSVRAPVAGRVEALLATPGQVLPAGSPVAQIVPDTAETRIVLLVPTRLASTLNVGSQLPVTLPLEANSAAAARVTLISDGNVTREEAASLLNAPQVEPLVRVEVELIAPESVPNLAAALRPGQRVSASVPDEKRSLWRHLVNKSQ